MWWIGGLCVWGVAFFWLRRRSGDVGALAWQSLAWIPFGLAVVWFGIFFGGLRGNFDLKPVRAYREWFWNAFADRMEQSGDWRKTVGEMRREIAPEAIESRVRALISSEASRWWLAAVFVLAAAVLVAAARPHLRFRSSGLMFLPLVMLGAGCWFAYWRNYSRLSYRHVMLSLKSERTMLNEWEEKTPLPSFSEQAVAAVLRTYLLERSNICHGEPYSLAEPELFGVPSEKSAEKGQSDL